MKIRKYLISIVTGTLLVSTICFINDVEAIDFSKNEEKYMQICSSGKLTNSNKSTCEEFNKYLKDKNKKLATELAEQKKSLSDTTYTIESIQKKLENINADISSKEKEIKYVETIIENTQKEIDKNNQLIKDRMYVMQSYMNDNSMINYIFSADSFTDLFARIDGFNELTYSDKQLIAQMIEDKKEVEKQKKALDSAKRVLESQKKQQTVIQAQYTKLLEKQRKNIAATQADVNITAHRLSQIDASLTAFYENSKKDDVGHVNQIPSSSNSNNNNSSNSTNNSNTNNNQNTGSSSKPAESDESLGIKIANYALSKQGARYYWGASGPTYFDCSGLVYWAHKQAGIKIGRTSASGYAASGKAVSYNNLQIGDVITFDYGSGVAHIGIYIGKSQMVHASGKGSSTVGQDPNQCVKVTSIAPGTYFYRYIYNCRRLY